MFESILFFFKKKRIISKLIFPPKKNRIFFFFFQIFLKIFMTQSVDICIQACKKDNLKVLTKELSRGPQLKNKLPEITIMDFHSQSFSLLHICSSYGSINCLNYLLSRGVDPSEKNNKDWNSLHFASKHGHLEIIKILILKGVNINSLTIEGVNIFFFF